MKQLFAIGLALWLGGCATLNRDIAEIKKVYTVATTTTISPTTVVVAVNAFDALKATATNYGRFCIGGKFVDAICSADNRRRIIKAVRAGTAARDQLELSISTNTPAAASLYNLLVTAVNSLTQSPALNNFRKGTQ